MAGRDVIPSIPPIPSDTPRGMRALLQALRDVVMVRSGQSKDQFNRSPTMQELVDLGLVTAAGARSGGTVVFQPPPAPPTPSEGYDPSTDTTPPPTPVGFDAGATPFSVILKWTPVLGHDNLRIAYAEVYSSTTNSLAGANFLGVGQHTFVHEFAYDPGVTTRYYWVRYCSIAGVFSNYAPSNTTGLAVPMVQDPNYVLDLISGEIREDDLATEVVTAINEGQTALTQVTALNGKFVVKVQAGTEGNATPLVAGFGLAVDNNTAGPNSRFYIAADRFAVFNPAFPTDESKKATFVIDTATNRVMMTGAMIQDATITDAHIVELAADKLFASSGTIADAIIGTGHIDYAKIERIISSTGYVNSGGQFNGWSIDKEGMIQAAAIRIYAPDGTIILGANDGSYAARLDSWLSSSNKVQGLNYNGGCDIMMPGDRLSGDHTTNRPAGWFKAGAATLPYWGTNKDTVILLNGQLINTAMRVNPGTRYEIVARVKSLAGSHTADLAVWHLTGDLPAGKTAIAPPSSGNLESAVTVVDAVGGPSVTTTLAANCLTQTGVYEIVTATWTPPANAKWASFGFNTQNEDIEVDYLLVGDQSTRVIDAVTPGNPINPSNVGTYMSGAIIDTGYIKDLAVNTLQLAGQAVTHPVGTVSATTSMYLETVAVMGPVFTNANNFSVPVIIGWSVPSGIWSDGIRTVIGPRLRLERSYGGGGWTTVQSLANPTGSHLDSAPSNATDLRYRVVIQDFSWNEVVSYPSTIWYMMAKR